MSGAGGKRRSLLADAIDSIGAAPVPQAAAGGAPAEPATAAFLERRGIAFDEIARTVKRPTIRLKPAECSIWPGNARDHAALTHDRCASLIDSIRAEGGNREPVVVRRTPQGDRPYELIVGTRRHFSVAWLNANTHPDIDLVARIETLDDEAAFRLADLENREREDVTDLERARNYQHAVTAYYQGVRTRMAERLAIPKQNLHNLLQLAELPDAVVAAFAAPGDLRIRHGMRLSPLLKDARHRDRIIAAANRIAAEQLALKVAGAARIEGSKVCERLVAAAQSPRAPAPPRGRKVLVAASGMEVGEVNSDTRASGLTVTILPRGAASVDEILEALRPVIVAARFSRD